MREAADRPESDQLSLPSSSSNGLQSASRRPTLRVEMAPLEPSAERAVEIDGIAGELAARFAGLRWLSLVDGQTAAADYMLQGRLTFDHIFSVTLTTMPAGRTLWFDRCDLRDESNGDSRRFVIEKVAAVAARIEAEESERVCNRPVKDLDGNELLWRARWHRRRATAEDLALAQGLLDRMARFWPESIEVMIEQAEVEAARVAILGGAAEAAAALHDRLLLIRDRDPFDARGWLLLGMTAMWRGEHDSALALMQKALELDPTSAPCHAQMGACRILAGSPVEGMAMIDAALQLNPHDIWNFHCFSQLALAKLMLGHHEKAAAQASHAITHRPAYPWSHAWKTAALWMGGNREDAEKAAEPLRRAEGGFDPEWLRQMPFRDASWGGRLHDALRAALNGRSAVSQAG